MSVQYSGNKGSQEKWLLKFLLKYSEVGTTSPLGVLCYKTQFIQNKVRLQFAKHIITYLVIREKYSFELKYTVTKVVTDSFV
jgi:hypothetical protein